MRGVFYDTEWCGVLSPFETHSLVGKEGAIIHPKSLSLEMHNARDTRIEKSAKGGLRRNRGLPNIPPIPLSKSDQIPELPNHTVPHNLELHPLTMSEDLATKIRRQVEFYFSGLNLKRDKFMREKMSADPDGCIQLHPARYH